MENYEKYVSLALTLGADHAVLCEIADIAFDERTILKCMFGCADWGKGCTCPSRPGFLKLREFRVILERYDKVLIVHSRDKRVAQKASYKVEAEAFLDGDVFAFSMSDCALCAECAGQSDKPCVNPRRARPSFHSVGISVFDTVKRLGLPIKTLRDPDREEQNWYSAVWLGTKA
ncbi:hypothetical protein FACS1894208_09840 [Clostridia bacterium]|nr:hypothetical protein FACS1894208_09840 [Clostridia bacterium]